MFRFCKKLAPPLARYRPSVCCSGSRKGHCLGGSSTVHLLGPKVVNNRTDFWNGSGFSSVSWRYLHAASDTSLAGGVDLATHGGGKDEASSEITPEGGKGGEDGGDDVAASDTLQAGGEDGGDDVAASDTLQAGGVDLAFDSTQGGGKDEASSEITPGGGKGGEDGGDDVAASDTLQSGGVDAASETLQAGGVDLATQGGGKDEASSKSTPGGGKRGEDGGKGGSWYRRRLPAFLFWEYWVNGPGAFLSFVVLTSRMLYRDWTSKVPANVEEIKADLKEEGRLLVGMDARITSGEEVMGGLGDKLEETNGLQKEALVILKELKARSTWYGWLEAWFHKNEG